MDELSAWLTLLRVPGLHAGDLQPLLELASSAASLVSASPATLRAMGSPTALIDYIQAPHDGLLSADLKWLEAPNHHIVTWGSPQYPALLAQLNDAPVGLYVRGDPNLLSLPQLAIVGSRNPTPSGRENAYEFAAHLGR